MTINEIAKIAGVSISTVSKIINNKAVNINIDTKERVLKIVKEYNYAPYASVKKASNAKSFILGVLLKSASETNLMLNGIMKTAQKNGYSTLVCDSQNNVISELKNITALCKHNVDGVIWEPVDGSISENDHYFTEQNISVCYVNQLKNEFSYNIDFFQMGYNATKKLIDYKHSKIGCFQKKHSLRSALVFEGFKKCLFDFQIPYHDYMCLAIAPEECYLNVTAFGITGIVSTHFALSLALCEKLNKYHYHIPQNLSLVSLRDDIRESIRFPEVSCIKIPYWEFGQYICKQLIDKCETGEITYSNFQADYPLENETSLDIPSSFRAKKIIVVGSINMDVTLNVDELPQPGKTVSTSKRTVILGGKGANQAVGAAKLGMEVSLIGKIGNDYDSALIFDSIEKNHVDMHGITRDCSDQTGRAYIHVQSDGESTISIYAGANVKLTPEDIKFHERLFDNSGFCLLQTEIPELTVLEAAKTAKSHGAKNILKPSALNKISDELIHYIDIFVPNRKEIDALCPDKNTLEEKADFFLNKGVEVVIITLGHLGCYLKTRNFSKSFPALDFVPVDTTGAADAFVSALAVYLLWGYDLEHTVRIASYAAGFCISRQGVTPALIDRNSLETYIQTLEPDLLTIPLFQENKTSF